MKTLAALLLLLSPALALIARVYELYAPIIAQALHVFPK